VKKFSEWRDSIDENMNASALRGTIGGGAVSVDPILRSKLRSKILDIVKEFPDKNPAELFQEIMAVVGQLLTKGGGATTSSNKMYNQLNQQSVQNPVQKNQQAQAQQNQQVQNQ
jgi:hypothetical protein